MTTLHLDNQLRYKLLRESVIPVYCTGSGLHIKPAPDLNSHKLIRSFLLSDKIYLMNIHKRMVLSNSQAAFLFIFLLVLGSNPGSSTCKVLALSLYPQPSNNFLNEIYTSRVKTFEFFKKKNRMNKLLKTTHLSSVTSHSGAVVLIHLFQDL